LRAALAANHFPSVTTHWLVDRDPDAKIKGGHYDPRCFDVHHLYSLIAGDMGHHAASEYGITPVYGTKPPANVWWTLAECGKAHP